MRPTVSYSILGKVLMLRRKGKHCRIQTATLTITCTSHEGQKIEINKSGRGREIKSLACSNENLLHYMCDRVLISYRENGGYKVL